VALPGTGEASPEVKAVFDEITILYAMDRVPAVFRWMGATRFSCRDTGAPCARPSPTGSSIA
jgi:hypothetical protein